MATLTIRKLDEVVKKCLRIQAAQHGISMEEEARCILRQALVKDEDKMRLGSKIHKHFAHLGGFDESTIPPRSTPRSAPDFSELVE